MAKGDIVTIDHPAIQKTLYRVERIATGIAYLISLDTGCEFMTPIKWLIKA